MPDHSPWRRADVALALLVGLTLMAAGLALELSERGLEPGLALVVSICSRSLDETLAHSSDLGRLALLTPVGLGLFLAGHEGLRLLQGARIWTASLSPARVAFDERLDRLMQKCGLTRDVILLQIDQPIVFTHGLITPQVWLSSGLMRLLTDDELEAVLRHEAYHRQTRDPLKIFLARCLSRALFFIPVAHDLCETYCVAKEIAADAAAAQKMGDALPLVRAIRKLLSLQPSLPGGMPALIGDPEATEARLLALLDPAQPTPLFPMKHLGFSVVWLVIFLAALIAPTAGHVPSFSECARPAALEWLKLGLL